ncbi:MAG: T9SS type A sorting domain-containing protein [bacterium]|nr:T9SS type A sorting domain-containing protein [bacterium]
MNIKIFSMAFIVFCVIELFPQKVGEAYALNINNIYLPLNNKGVLADANIPPLGSGGQFAENVFLFSAGFFLSGFSNGTLWANAVASASLVEDYLKGPFGDPYNFNAVLYRLRSNDIPFGQSWVDWVDAVALGADFYDGDLDGFYNPVDLNGNNQWDPNEDRPDLLGDEMLWCVYHDGLPALQRRWNTVEPQGIEIRQTVFAYSSSPYLQNTIFIRYRIKNTGVVANEMTDVYFGVWGDPDIGSATDDLVGCDTLLQSGFTYNDGSDPVYGNNPPTFLDRFLAGPRIYIPGETFIDINGNGSYNEGIDTPLDTAFVHRGQFLGVTLYPGAKNQILSSSIEYRNGDPTLNDPNTAFEARNYILGLDKIGNMIDPCTFPYGDVRGGINCADVNPFFWLSGDPVTNTGWINNSTIDQRQMQNIGPFTLKAGEEYEVFVAYVVGQGSNALNSITVTKDLSISSQILYDLNFDANNVPVELSSFTAVSEFGKVKLHWTTSTETNNLGFEIERKIIGGNENNEWVRIGFVQGSGTTTQIINYNYVDDVREIKTNSLVYRLKQIDYNGSYEYSDEVLIDNLAPAFYRLDQNYPNPFNPATTISYGIPVKSNVLIKVFNSLGEEIKTLVREEKEAGTYIIEFNASGIPSGVYFYQLKIENFIKTKKMILMK